MFFPISKVPIERVNNSSGSARNLTDPELFTITAGLLKSDNCCCKPGLSVVFTINAQEFEVNFFNLFIPFTDPFFNPDSFRTGRHRIGF